MDDTAKKFRWRNMINNRNNMSLDTTFKDHEAVCYEDIVDIETPLAYFKMFFDNGIINHIALHTNLYISQCKINKGIPSITTTEIEQFLGVLLKMCIIQAPYYRYYLERATRV